MIPNYLLNLEYKSFKKGGPKVKYPAKFKWGFQIQYGAEAEGVILGVDVWMS